MPVLKYRYISNSIIEHNLSVFEYLEFFFDLQEAGQEQGELKLLKSVTCSTLKSE